MREHPFDVKAFIKDNKELVKKYQKKNTYNLEVDDFLVRPDQCYKGTHGLISVGQTFDMTDLQKLEYIKCMKSCVYFTRKYIKIISIDDGVIPFRLYPFQEKLLELYQNNRFVISCTARQMGKTITTAAFILWFGIFHPTKVIAILANKATQSREILARIQLAFEMLPNFLKPGVKFYNKGSMKLENESEMFCAATSSSSIRGKSCALVYIDEAAFIPNDMEFYESTYPTISSGRESRVILSSTPKGQRGLFYKIWTESEAGTSVYKNLKAPWWMNPTRDEKWKNDTISATSPQQFRQEFECVTGETFVYLTDDLSKQWEMSISDLHELVEDKDVNTMNLNELTEDKKAYVYKITRNDFLCYVGVTINPKRRLSEHSRSPRFSNGILDFEILFEGSYEDCLIKEEMFIDKFDTFNVNEKRIL